MIIKDPNKIVLAKSQKEIRIFLDLDGVLTNWIKAACETFDIDLENEEIRKKLKQNDENINCFLTNKELWEKIDKEGSEWWENLEILPWAKKLYTEMKKQSNLVCFLTSPSPNPDSAKGKVIWIKKHFNNTKDFLIGTNKYFCANNNAILVDDMQKNIDKFVKHGGNGFLFPGPLSIFDGDVDIDETIQKIVLKIENIKKG